MKVLNFKTQGPTEVAFLLGQSPSHRWHQRHKYYFSRRYNVAPTGYSIKNDHFLISYLAAQIETHAGFQNQFYEYSVAFITQILNYPS